MLSGTKIEFFMEIEYEKLPKFCDICSMMGHERMDCRSAENLNGNRGNQENTNGKNDNFVRRELPALNKAPLFYSTNLQQVDRIQNVRNEVNSTQAGREANTKEQQKLVEAQIKHGSLRTTKNHIVSHSGNDTARVKPWRVDRSAKLDRLAIEIMAAEAMKIINKAYEDVFEGSQAKKMGEKEVFNDGNIVDIDKEHSLHEMNNTVLSARVSQRRIWTFFARV